LAEKLLLPFYPVLNNTLTFFPPIFSMKKSSRRDHPSEPSQRNRRRQHSGGDGRWEFSSTGSLFTLGSTESAKSTAYYTASGELRFLPR
jgi:hypothetical protein